MIQLSAQPVLQELEKKIREDVANFVARNGRRPKLATVLVGDDPASTIYVRKKGEKCTSLGFESTALKFTSTATPDEVRTAVETLNQDPSVDGILIQRPLPPAFREEEVMYWVHPSKDVDAFHPENVGRLVLGQPCFQPCTPAGVMELLRFYGVETRGRVACVIGRSSIVGKPMATLLLQADATVLHCHSRTPDLRAIARQADILVVAAGKPRLIDGTFVKPGAAVIDVGIHRGADGKVFGDVDFASASAVAGAITPVPGGVGPMTIAMLMRNTVR